MGGVDVVAVDEFVGPTDGGAPAFEDVLGAGVVGGVWVVVEVAVGLGNGELLVVPAEDGIDGGGGGEAGDRPELVPRQAPFPEDGGDLGQVHQRTGDSD